MGTVLMIIAAAMLSAGCASNEGRSIAGEQPLATASPRPQRLETGAPAMVDGRTVTWEDLRPLVLEAAGGEALREIALDRRLAEEARRRGVRIGAEDVERERTLLLESLRESSGDPGLATASRLLEEVRRRRGLGEARFQALLTRTALLRALVQEDVEVAPEAVRDLHTLLHGPKYEVRLITVATPVEAQAVRRRLDSGEPFGEVAARMSTDSSAPRGGLIEPVSPADPTYPLAIREALRGMRAGDTSAPIGIDTGLAIVRVEAVIEGDGTPFETVRGALEREARARQERALMARLAERLVGAASVRALDPSLEWSWSNAQGVR